MSMKKWSRRISLFLILSLILTCTALAAETVLPVTPGSGESGQAVIPEASQTPDVSQGEENGAASGTAEETENGGTSVILPEAGEPQTPAGAEENESGTETPEPVPTPGGNVDIAAPRPPIKEETEPSEQTDAEVSVVLKDMDGEDQFGTISVAKGKDGAWSVTKEEYYASESLRIFIDVGAKAAVCLIFLCGALVYGAVRRRKSKRANG